MSTSSWLREVDLALARRRPVLVIGALQDRAVWEGQLHEPLEALGLCLRRLGYAHVAQWTASTGWSGDALADVPIGQEPDLPSPPQDDPVAALLLAALRAVQASTEPVAVTITGIDRLLLHAGPVAFDALRATIAACGNGARTSCGATSTLILHVASDQRLPDELAREQRLDRVSARPPDRETRTAALRKAIHLLEDAPDASDEEREAALDALALSLEGDAASAIEHLARASRVHAIPYVDHRRLIARFRAGIDEDPWEALPAGVALDIDRALGHRICGQGSALATLRDRFPRARAGLSVNPPTSGAREPRLRAVLLGDTGVGKTELAKALAELIFGDESALVRIDMSEFQQPHSAERLTGAPPGYVGHNEGGQLTRALEERPYCVLLLDEMEKAHPEVWERLMNTLDAGRLTDARGRTVSFGDAVVLMTTNIGAPEIAAKAGRGADLEALQATGLAAFKDFCSRPRNPAPGAAPGLGRRELWGRLQSDIIVFDVLRDVAVDGIVRKFCAGFAETFRMRLGAHADVDVDALVAHVHKELGAPGSWDGRKIKGIVEHRLVAPISRQVLASPPPGRVSITFADGYAVLTPSQGGDGARVTT